MRLGERTSLILVIIVLLLLALGGWLLWKQMSRPKVGPFGSIAISATTQDYGASWGYAKLLDSYARSLDECNGRVAAKDCTAQMSLNGNCGALVMSVGRKLNFVVTDSDKTQASAYAMAQCQASGASDCVLKENFCGSNP